MARLKHMSERPRDPRRAPARSFVTPNSEDVKESTESSNVSNSQQENTNTAAATERR